jgi:hypothetical protein
MSVGRAASDATPPVAEQVSVTSGGGRSCRLPQALPEMTDGDGHVFVAVVRRCGRCCSG